MKASSHTFFFLKKHLLKKPSLKLLNSLWEHLLTFSSLLNYVKKLSFKKPLFLYFTLFSFCVLQNTLEYFRTDFTLYTKIDFGSLNHGLKYLRMWFAHKLLLLMICRHTTNPLLTWLKLSCSYSFVYFVCFDSKFFQPYLELLLLQQIFS